MKLTSDQQRAIEMAEPRFTVWAAAGSGKTSVLVQRFLACVLDRGIRPDRILTITFTRRAAAEMKRRIVTRLREIGRPEDAQIAETGPIQTIHSFCERILRENALLARLDPQFEIMDGATADALKAEAVQEALMASTDLPEAQDLIAAYGAKPDFRRPLMLIELINDSLDQLRGRGWTLDEILRDFGSGASAFESVTRVLAMAHDPALLDLPAEARIPQLREQWRGRKPAWLTAYDREYEQEEAWRTAGLAQISVEAWGRMEDRMRERMEFDQAAMEALAVSLVESNRAVCERIQGQFDAVLVDESQDVNPVQHRLLQSLGLGEEMMVGDPQQSIYGFRNASLSLFMSRIEDLPVVRLRQNFRSTPGVLAFVDAYFASRWEQYEPMLTPGAGADLFDDPPIPPFEGVEFWPMEALDLAASAKMTAELAQEIWDENPEATVAVLTQRTETASSLAELVQRHGVAARLMGQTERYYTRLEVRDLANALRALTDPSDRHSWLAFLRGPCVGLSLDAVVLLAKCPQIPEALDTFDSPVEGDAARLDRLKSWAIALRKRADRIPAWELAAELIAKSPFLTELAVRPNGRSMIANVRKLLRLATEHPLLGPYEFANRIQDIQQLRHKESMPSAQDDRRQVVSMMTIHSSKGLEFDAVILPETLKPPMAHRGKVLFSPLTGLYCTKGEGNRQSAGFHHLLTKRKADDLEEKERLLYVAMTRAKKRLAVAVAESGAPNSDAGRISQKFGFPKAVPPGVRIRRPVKD